MRERVSLNAAWQKNLKMQWLPIAAYLVATPIYGAKPPVQPTARFLVPIESVEREIRKAKSNNRAVVIENDDEVSSTDIKYRLPEKFSKFATHLVRSHGFEYSAAYLMLGDKVVLGFSEFGGLWGYISGDELQIFLVDYPILAEGFSSADYDYYYIVINKSGVKSYHCIFDHSRIWNWKSMKVDPGKFSPYPQAILKYLYGGAGMGGDVCSDYREFIRKSEEDFRRRLFVEQ